jgi:hypothetical protein
MEKKITPTHTIKGWFLGAVKGQDEGELYTFKDETPAQYDPKHNCFIVVQNYTEVAPDGSESTGTDLLHLDPSPIRFKAHDKLGRRLDTSHTITKIK